jgi:hypothetical protein
MQVLFYLPPTNKGANAMTQKYSREDRLFVLATICKQRNITPASNLYKSLINKTCAANFMLPKPKVDELTKILTSAYHADRWRNLLGTEETPQKEYAPEIPQQQKSKTAKQNAAILKGMAKKDTYDGVGRLILKEVQVELGPVTSEEILELWQNCNLKDTIEQTDNIFLIYWGGKADLEETRCLKPVTWNPQRPTLEANREIYVETIEKDIVLQEDGLGGEVLEDDENVVKDRDEEDSVEA